MFEFRNKVVNSQVGRTHVFSLGQAGFIIKSAGGQLLAIDLYLSDCVERVEGDIGFKRLLPKILQPGELDFDVIVTTHFHRDHFDIDSMDSLMQNKKTKLFAALDCKEDVEALKISKEQVTYVEPSFNCQTGDFKLTFINCDHGLQAPKAVGVIVTVDKKNIVFAGDTCLRLDFVDEYKSKGNVDVFIAPINGAFGNLSEIDCVKLSKAIKPGLTIPCHYGMFASHGGNLKVFTDAMQEKGLKFKLLPIGEQYTL